MKQAHTRGKGSLGACLIMMILAMQLVGCGGGSSGSTPAVEGGSSSGDGSSPGSGVPGGLPQLGDDPGLLTDIPEIIHIEVLANSGLQVAYTEAGQQAAAPALFVETQWLHMQTCLELTGVAPVVVIRADAVIPFTSMDDVIHDIEGIPVASATLRDIPVMQISTLDFDGSLGNAGFNLRSIIGRMLWISAGLAERNYPFSCARTSPE